MTKTEPSRAGRKPEPRPLKDIARRKEFWKWIRGSYSGGQLLCKYHDLAGPIAKALVERGIKNPTFESLASSLADQFEGKRTMPNSTIRGIALLCGVDASDIRAALNTGGVFPTASNPERNIMATESLEATTAHESLGKQLGYELAYRGWMPDEKTSADVSRFLAERYEVENLTRWGSLVLPITTVWKTTTLVDPDEILVRPLIRRKATYEISEAERGFLKREHQGNPRHYEGLDYRMVQFDLDAGKLPRLHGATGGWYDHVLSQMALRWELAREIQMGLDLRRRDALPRRKRYEEAKPSHSIRQATRRCAAMAIGTLLVIESHEGLKCLLPKRGDTVVQWPKCYGVCPDGMFESASKDDVDAEWSMRLNVVREFMEEVLGDEEETHPHRLLAAQMKRKETAQNLEKLLKRNKKFSITGFSIDLTTLVPEISTVVVIAESDLEALGSKGLNWEYERREGIRTLTRKTVHEFCDEVGSNIMPSAAVTYQLGVKWLEAQRYL